MSGRPWKSAASLVLAAASWSQKSTRFNYHIAMLQRTATSRFFPRRMVFPGGVLDAADASPDWLSLVEQLEPDLGPGGLAKRLRGSMRLPIYEDVEKQLVSGAKCGAKSKMTGEIILRITALRETFEETGLLLARDQQGNRVLLDSTSSSLASDSNTTDVQSWQTRTKSDPSAFLALFHHLSLLPDLTGLDEWSCWLTPAVMPSRYDTVFYFTALPATFHITPDLQEASQSVWRSPDELLRDHFSNKLEFAPPQVYELSRFYRFPDLVQLETFSAHRSVLGSERWTPIVYFDPPSNSAVSIYPGDQRHPEVVDELEGPIPLVPDGETLDDVAREWSKDEKKNRMLQRSSIDPITFEKKVDRLTETTVDRLGHVQPIGFEEFRRNEASHNMDKNIPPSKL